MSTAASKATYLAGPMTGYPQFNFPMFEDAAKHLRMRGLHIISPAELDNAEIHKAAMASSDGKLDNDGKIAGSTWGDLLSRDVKVVADLCDSIAFLPGWEKSRGARLEAFVGILCNHKFYFYYPLTKGLIDVSKYEIQDILYSKAAR